MTERLVPEYNMQDGTLPVTGLSELQAHLEELVNDPATPFNAKLFDDVELQLNGVSFLSYTLPIINKYLHLPFKLLIHTRIQHSSPLNNSAPSSHNNPQADNSRPNTPPLTRHQTPLSPELFPLSHHRGPSISSCRFALSPSWRKPPRLGHHPQSGSYSR